MLRCLEFKDWRASDFESRLQASKTSTKNHQNVAKGALGLDFVQFVFRSKLQQVKPLLSSDLHVFQYSERTSWLRCNLPHHFSRG